MSENQTASEPGQSRYRRLYRSLQQKVLGGVCGGLSEYFNLDVVIVRVLWVIFTLLGGAGVLVYLLCWIIIPPRTDQAVETGPRSSAGLVLGVALLVIGGIWLMSWVGWHSWWVFPGEFHWFAFPALALALGIGLLIGFGGARSVPPDQPKSEPAADNPSGEESSANQETPPTPRRAYRSRNQRIAAGVCGGLGEYFNLDPTIVRILWVLFAIASLGMALVAYVILIFVIPEEPI